MRYQLRDFQITPGKMDRWLTEWKAHVLPLRTQTGFQVLGAWSNPDTNRFVWILAHDGDFEEADRAYYASAERRSVEPDPARFIEKAHAEFVSPAI